MSAKFVRRPSPEGIPEKEFLPTYVLITPARNEEVSIENTIRSVVGQTVRPLKWVIVSDGSTDGTDDIIKKYATVHNWIEFLRMPERKERHFAGKVGAFNAGYERLKEFEFEVIGNLDADITFGTDYFHFLLSKFGSDLQLGVAGTPFVENGKHYNYRFSNIEHVSGACQLFRHACFQEIGGYHPIKGGGIDWVAVTTARMKGWKTRTFVEKVCIHHRTIGTGDSSSLGAWFRYGRKDYFLGGHPLWQIFRTFYQMKSKPYIFGGVLLFLGYAWAWSIRMERPVSMDLIAFHQSEQLKRLRKFFNQNLPKS